MPFITESDYSVQARQDVLTLLDSTEDRSTILQAENIAIDQIKKRLGGRYDMQAVFNKTGDERDMYLVMIVIDIAIYHLYSQKAPRKISEYRNDRYQDAIEWLRDVGNGETRTDFPTIPNFEGDVRIFSIHKTNDNKY